jgi:hypothetical protein
MSQIPAALGRRRRRGGEFSPAVLFASGEQGAWYDASDLTTLFQDAFGAVPVTAVEQPVRLMLDKSRGLALGPEVVANGDFEAGLIGVKADGSGSVSTWALNSTAPISGTQDGRLTITTASASSRPFVNFSSSVGSLVNTATYRVAFDYQVLSGTFVVLNALLAGNLVTTNRSLTGSGRFEAVLRAGSSTVDKLYIYAGDSVCDVQIDNISVRELPGSHALASADARRPVLSARVNQFVSTESLNNAYWTRLGMTITENTADTLAPNGTQTAAKAVVSANEREFSGPNQITLFPVGTTVVWSIWAKKGTVASWPFRVSAAGATGNPWNTTFNFDTGTFSGTTAGLTPAATVAGDGWYRLTFTFTVPAATTNLSIQWRPFANTAAGVGDEAYFWGADARLTNDGVNLPAYQRVTSSTDYDTAGFPLYLRFDGTDDCLFTGNVDFSATDEVTVCAGVRKLSDAITTSVVTHTVSSVTDGSFGMSAPNSNTINSFGSFSRGTTTRTNNLIGAQYAAPQTAVVSILADISAPSVQLRHNTIANTPTTTDQGTGNYANAAMFIGARNNAADFLNGRLYQLVVRGALTGTPLLGQLEGFVNAKTQAY